MKTLLLITAAAGLVGLGAAAVEAQTIGQVQAQASGVAQPNAPAAQASDRAHEVHKTLEAGDNPGYAYGRDDTRVQGDAAAKARVKADPRGRSRAATVSGARVKADTPAADATVKAKDRTETEVTPPN
jgi:hypothetical protein